MSMSSSQISAEFKNALITIVAAAASGAIAGAASGWTFAQLPYEMPFRTPAASSTSTSTIVEASTTASVPNFEVVSVERKPVEPILPPVFASRPTPIAGIYRLGSGAVLSDAQLAGQAVAVTTDGWFVAPLAAIEGMKLQEIVLWHDGTAATATRGIVDERASVVFLKSPFKNLTAPAFARYEDVAPGLPIWIERRPGGYESSSIASLHAEIGDLKGIPSRLAARRPAAATFARAGDIGAAVWDSNGTLLGIASGKPGDAFPFIPSSAWAPSLYGIFSDGAILHADLGVRSADLSSLRLVSRDPLIPDRGAWIIPDKAAKAPAVDKDSPGFAAGLQEGDVITRVDRDILDGSADLGEVLVQYKPGSRVALTVVRGGNTIELQATLGSMKVSRELR
jgi:S1-C subfamily serine protease